MVGYRNSQLPLHTFRLLQGPEYIVATDIPKKPSHEADHELTTSKHMNGMLQRWLMVIGDA